MDEFTQAISFTNSYFALVDGLAAGLENHLAEDVVLDWFGRTVKGRKNVTAFIEAHKVNSRHMFSNIKPVPGIGYKKKHLNRKKIYSYQSQVVQNKDTDTDYKETSLMMKSHFHFSNLPSTRDEIKDVNQNEIDAKGISLIDDMTYDLNEGDLSNLFKLEITSTNIEEIEQNINRIKLEEEMVPTIKAIKRECGQGDGPVVVETSTIKYVEANGEIEFSRKFWKRDAWDAYHSAISNIHTWRRSCKLQIAYSMLTGCQSMEGTRIKKEPLSRFGQPKGRLPSLEEVNEISNRLVPNTNGFGGLFKSIDFYEDRNDFLEALQIEMTMKDPRISFLSPQYVQNKLIINKPSIDTVERNDENQKRFVFNYQIHLIIYEGRNKCRMNLLHEFEKMNT